MEICAGAGGQALGLDSAGFRHVALVEYEDEYCKVLRENRPEWNVICGDVHDFDGTPYKGIDLLAGRRFPLRQNSLAKTMKETFSLRRYG